MNPNKFFGHSYSVTRMTPTFLGDVWLSPLFPGDILIPLHINTDRTSSDPNIVFAKVLSKNGLCEIVIYTSDLNVI